MGEHQRGPMSDPKDIPYGDSPLPGEDPEIPQRDPVPPKRGPDEPHDPPAQPTGVEFLLVVSRGMNRD